MTQQANTVPPKNRPATVVAAISRAFALIAEDLDATRDEVRNGGVEIIVKLGQLSEKLDELSSRVERIHRENLDGHAKTQGMLSGFLMQLTAYEQDLETHRRYVAEQLAKLRSNGHSAT